jgi:type IV secretion system protein VirD4
MKLIKENETDLSRFTVDSFNAYISLNERAARSALLDIQKALAPFRNERVVAATSITDIDIASLQRRPVTIYLAPNITDMTILRPLLTLFVQQIMDLLTREHNPAALPVYFLLDEFRQLKRMDEILNKLPYVAGYNIKLAFIIQDLKNIDEIYGETARHSLLGNCGLQLILGANDQATADYTSRALGKRTIRYQSESRTVELMGLPRRTKVEQIRERDLMMPQEIRQMPEKNAILLVEGQRPIQTKKIRYYKVEPFKTAAAAPYRMVEIPEVELTTMPMVPAVLQDYEQSPTENLEKPELSQATDKEASPSITPRRTRTVDLASKGSIPMQQAPEKLVTAELRLVKTAQKLKAAVERVVDDNPNLSLKQRKSIHDILANTVPDPEEIGT